jgi:hypothetical protein
MEWVVGEHYVLSYYNCNLFCMATRGSGHVCVAADLSSTLARKCCVRVFEAIQKKLPRATEFAPMSSDTACRVRVGDPQVATSEGGTNGAIPH